MDYLKRSWVEIDLKNMLSNLNAVKNMCGEATVIAVVKADAYGHGAKVIAPFLEQNGVNFFAVSNIDEAMELRYAGIVSPILILGHTPIEYVEQLDRFSLSQTVMSPEYAEELLGAARGKGVSVKIHIKLDTGMNRIGFICRENKDTAEEISAVLSNKEFIYEGLFTHFASADTDKEFTNLQYGRFNGVREALEAKGYKAEYYHTSNSASIMLHPECRLNAVRAGIVLYGLTPDESIEIPSDIKPVMSFYSAVVQVKEISAAESVSYGRTFKASKPITAATLPVGYADGFRRALSNKGKVLINGKEAPIIGRVCMDQTVVDVSSVPEASVGQKVELFGKNLPVERMAQWCDTINYEIICGISRRVPRVYTVGDNKILAKSYIHEEEK